jgi:hypothetical protein
MRSKRSKKNKIIKMSKTCTAVKSGMKSKTIKVSK